jgi:deoxyribose-phosphate aldolase
MSSSTAALAALIDATLLKADATVEDVLALTKEAHDAGCASVCVNSALARCAASELARLHSATKLCVVVGFPLGACSTAAKVADTVDAIACGALEVDMVSLPHYCFTVAFCKTRPQLPPDVLLR